jgi:23S rRNA (cytosine1962-C5)-methyltransferase
MITLRLKKREEKRALAGHPWIFSNELKTMPTGVQPGDLVRVEAANRRPLGIGYVNPRTLIAIRLLTAGADDLDPDFISDRIKRAVELRGRLYPGSTTYRAVYGESDGLPGLIVDRYDSAVAVQILTAGMEMRREEILSAVRSNLEPDVLVLRNDSTYRQIEGLPIEKSVESGEWRGPVPVRLEGMALLADLMEGQKTGLFLDQRDNLALPVPFSADAKVLDCFCYTGAWGIKAVMAGASSVTAVDSSARALKAAEVNARENGFADRWKGVRGDAFQVLDSLSEESAFDVIILDPPSFVRRKDRLASAKNRYRAINMKAISLLAPGGVLVTCSCSHHMDAHSFRQVLSEAAAKSGRRAVILAARGQAKDHPVLLAARETEYLKCLALKVW